jgi:hypothetical protein
VLLCAGGINSELHGFHLKLRLAREESCKQLCKLSLWQVACRAVWQLYVLCVSENRVQVFQQVGRPLQRVHWHGAAQAAVEYADKGAAWCMLLQISDQGARCLSYGLVCWQLCLPHPVQVRV